MKLNKVTLVLCDRCLEGKGGLCNVPGCALIRRSAPDVALNREEVVLHEDLEPNLSRARMKLQSALDNLSVKGLVIGDNEVAAILEVI